MKRHESLIRIAWLLLVVGVLGYGSREALAGPSNAPCDPDPPVTLGFCPSGGDPACDDWCKTEFGQEWFGYCTLPDPESCCRCLL